MYCKMDLARLRMLVHEFLNRYLDIVPEEANLIVLDSNSDMCMANNIKDTKHTRHKENAFCKEWRNMQDAQNRLVLRKSTVGRHRY